jgi:excisionase family DNA binding protein
MAKVLDQPSIPSQIEVAQARRSFDELKSERSNAHFILSSQTGKQTPLSENAFNYLLAILGEMAKGNAVLVVPLRAELSTYEAAELLGVSRPFLIRLLDKGELSYRVIGKHRRVQFDDLIVYKEKTQRRREKAIAEMTAADDEMFGLGSE